MISLQILFTYWFDSIMTASCPLNHFLHPKMFALAQKFAHLIFVVKILCNPCIFIFNTSQMLEMVLLLILFTQSFSANLKWIWLIKILIQCRSTGWRIKQVSNRATIITSIEKRPNATSDYRFWRSLVITFSGPTK